MVIILDTENFGEEVLTSDIPVIVDFWAPWCGPCRMMAPIFEKVSLEYKNRVKFAKLNTQDYPELAEQFDIRGIPTLLMFKEGEVVGDIVGLRDEGGLKEEINRLTKK